MRRPASLGGEGGRGFEYLDESGERITDEEMLGRIRALAIPPGWEDVVWICSDPLGHIQEGTHDKSGYVNLGKGAGSA